MANSISIRDAIRDAIAEEMRSDKDVLILGEEVAEYNGAYKVSRGLLDEFGPKRVIDTTITEYGFAGIGVGAAMNGLRPIVEFMTFNFAMQAIDHIVNSAAKTKYMSGGLLSCPIVFRGPNGAASRVGAQHSQCYANWYASIPGLKVIAPYTATDHKALMKQAIKDDAPVVFLENELLYGVEFDIEEKEVEIGKANVIKEGEDVTIVAFSIKVGYALKAAEMLAEIGVNAEVIDLRTIRPLDSETIIQSVMKTNRLVIVDEGWFFGSVSASIGALVQEHAFDYLDAPFICVNSKDVPLPYAANLEALALPQVEDIFEACKKVCYIS